MARYAATARFCRATSSDGDVRRPRRIDSTFCALGPGDLREIIFACQKSVTEAVPRFGGFVAEYMGDGVVAYFGSGARARHGTSDPGGT